MRSKDVMTTSLVTVTPDATVHDIAVLMVEKGIAAVPVTDHGIAVGIVSEGDLIHRREIATHHRRRSSWLKLVDDDKAREMFLKERGMTAREIMSSNLITVSEDASLKEVADSMEKNSINQVLVMRNTKLVGMVTRANIVCALAARPETATEPSSADDDQIRYTVIEALEKIPGASPWLTTVIVTDGVVDLYGTVENEKFLEPSRAEVQKIKHVLEVRDHRNILQPY